MQKNPDKNLLKASVAVESYFDSLLQEQNDTNDTPQENLINGSLNLLAGLEQELERIQPLSDSSDGESDESVEPKISKVARQRKHEQEAEFVPDSTYHDEIQFPMQCLMFQVQQHELSIPLIEMGSVVPWGQELTRLPQSPDWLLGLLKYRDRNVQVVDTASLLSATGKSETGSGRHILVLADDNWAITCDQIGQVVQLCEADVQWNRSSLKGLAMGAIKQSLALLLDPTRLLQHLNAIADAKGLSAEPKN